MRSVIKMAALAACGWAGSMSASAATVVDGSFENPVTTTYSFNPTATGATFNAGSGVARTGMGYAAAPNGSQIGFLQSTNLLGSTVGSISLSLTDLVVGQAYQIVFAAASRPNYTADPFTVSVGGDQIGSYTTTSTNWTDFYSGVFTATAATSTLTFAGSATGFLTEKDVGLDNVRIGAVPEVSTWSMMIAGFGMIGFAMRRKARAERARLLGPI